MRLRAAITVLAIMGLLPVCAGAQASGLPVASFTAGGTGLTSFYVIGFELGPWQEYLAQELTPPYMLPDDAMPVRVSWMKNSELLIMPDFAADLDTRPETLMNFNF